MTEQKTIIVFEDDERWQQHLVEELQEAGHKVHAFDQFSDEALAMLGLERDPDIHPYSLKMGENPSCSIDMMLVDGILNSEEYAARAEVFRTAISILPDSTPARNVPYLDISTEGRVSNATEINFIGSVTGKRHGSEQIWAKSVVNAVNTYFAEHSRSTDPNPVVGEFTQHLADQQQGTNRGADLPPQ